MAREFAITVRPVGGVWSVSCDAGLEPLLFLTGARAESHARELAERLSQFGDNAFVLVHDRSSVLAGATCYTAASPTVPAEA